MTQLSNEDLLRLNVLCAQTVYAIRLDEGRMQLFALSEKGEIKMQLHPSMKDEAYVRAVREFLSGHFLGSPRGYPVFIERWTRMGQARDDNLANLLKLGEPEAVVAVVNAAGLTAELAQWAWWAMPDVQNARSMLRHPALLNSDIAKELAQFLVEFLPFEEEASDIIESVRLVLKEDLIDVASQQQLWRKGKNKTAYLVGFLQAIPDHLPNTAQPHPDYTALQASLSDLDNALAQQLLRVLSPAGQTFIRTCEQVLKKPANQEVVNLLFEVIAAYFANIQPPALHEHKMDMPTLQQQITQFCADNSAELHDVLRHVPQTQLQAMLLLSGLNYAVLRPIFSRTTAIGSLMRRKLAPVSDIVLAELARLQ